MAITLKVDDYCQNCPEFEPDVHRQVIYSMDEKLLDTAIRCEHRVKCDRLIEYLEKQIKEKET